MLYDANSPTAEVGVVLGIVATVAVTYLFTQPDLKTGLRPIKHHLGLAVGYLAIVPVVINNTPTAVVPTRTQAIAWVIAVALVAILTHVVVVLARRLKSDGSVDRPATLPEAEPPRDTAEDTSTGNGPPQAIPARIRVYSSVSQYRGAVAAAESSATDMAFIQYRIPPHFKTSEGAAKVASERYGRGNPDAERYRTSQSERKAIFHNRLTEGARIREIYPEEKILSYVTNGALNPTMWPMKPDEVVSSLQNWCESLQKYTNYMVGIATDQFPLKYHLFDRRLAIFHEPLRKGEAVRVNSFFIEGEDAVKPFVDDFELTWSLIPTRRRETEKVVEWIQGRLVPLALERAASGS